MFSRFIDQVKWLITQPYGYIFIAWLIVRLIMFITGTGGEIGEQKYLLGTVKVYVWGDTDECEPQTGRVLREDLSKMRGLGSLHIVALESGDESCNILYNRNGCAKDSWILTFRSRGLHSFLFGDLTLWSDGSIKRKHSVFEKGTQINSIGWYRYVE